MPGFTLDSDIEESPAKPFATSESQSWSKRLGRQHSPPTQPERSRLSTPSKLLPPCITEEATPKSSVPYSSAAPSAPAQDVPHKGSAALPPGEQMPMQNVEEPKMPRAASSQQQTAEANAQSSGCPEGHMQEGAQREPLPLGHTASQLKAAAPAACSRGRGTTQGKPPRGNRKLLPGGTEPQCGPSNPDDAQPCQEGITAKEGPAEDLPRHAPGRASSRREVLQGRNALTAILSGAKTSKKSAEPAYGGSEARPAQAGREAEGKVSKQPKKRGSLTKSTACPAADPKCVDGANRAEGGAQPAGTGRAGDSIASTLARSASWGAVKGRKGSSTRGTGNAAKERSCKEKGDEAPITTASGSTNCEDEEVVIVAVEGPSAPGPRPAARAPPIKQRRLVRGQRKQTLSSEDEQVESISSDSDLRTSDLEDEGSPAPAAAAMRRGRRARKDNSSDGSYSDAKTAGPGKANGDFFLTAAQRKRRKLVEEQKAVAKEAKSAQGRAQDAYQQLLAEKSQRAQEKAIMAAGRKPHPFMQPRAQPATSASDGGAPKPARKEPTRLQPCLPPLHITQATASVAPHQSYPHWTPVPLQPRIRPAAVWEHAASAASRFSGLMARIALPRASKPVEAAGEDTIDVQDPENVADSSHNALWTQKYRPTCAAEVCGNEEAVGQLLSWLQNWHETAPPAESVTTAQAAASDSDDEYLRSCAGRRSSSPEWDSDAEAPLAQPQPCNAVWLSGPSGCGKSAAIAAVAQELGLVVIEVNPGTDRAGANVMRSVGEATQSNRMLPSAASLVLESSNAAGSIPAVPGSSSGTLVVFEEVDSLAEEDRGYLSALCLLISDSKRPIILTSQSSQPPASLASLRMRQITFQGLSAAQIRGCLSRIYAAECLAASDYVLNTVTAVSQGDLRKGIFEAQLWREQALNSTSSTCTDLSSLECAMLSSANVADCEQQACGAEAAIGRVGLTEQSKMAVSMDLLASLDTLHTLDDAVNAAEYELSDDHGWQGIESCTGLRPLLDDCIPVLTHLLWRSFAGPSPLHTTQPQRPTDANGGLQEIVELLRDAAPREQAGSIMGRVGCARHIAYMASLEEDRREAEELVPSSPRRRGRRRRFLHYLAEDVGMTEEAIQRANRLHSFAVLVKLCLSHSLGSTRTSSLNPGIE